MSGDSDIMFAVHCRATTHGLTSFSVINLAGHTIDFACTADGLVIGLQLFGELGVPGVWSPNRRHIERIEASLGFSAGRVTNASETARLRAMGFIGNSTPAVRLLSKTVARQWLLEKGVPAATVDQIDRGVPAPVAAPSGAQSTAITPQRAAQAGGVAVTSRPAPPTLLSPSIQASFVVPRRYVLNHLRLRQGTCDGRIHTCIERWIVLLCRAQRQQRPSTARRLQAEPEEDLAPEGYYYPQRLPDNPCRPDILVPRNFPPWPRHLATNGKYGMRNLLDWKGDADESTYGTLKTELKKLAAFYGDSFNTQRHGLALGQSALESAHLHLIHRCEILLCLAAILKGRLFSMQTPSVAYWSMLGSP